MWELEVLVKEMCFGGKDFESGDGDIVVIGVIKGVFD